MKKATNFIVLIALLIGCKELPPKIDFNLKTIGLLDTNYISLVVPSPVNKMVFIEDITGVRCTNCPTAAEKIHNYKIANPDQLVSLGVYPSALTNFMTPWPGFEALITPEADDIFSQIYGSPGSIPTGGVNRKIFSGETTVNVSYNKWAGYGDIVKTEESPLIITGKVVSNDTINRKSKINIKVLFTTGYAEELNLSVYLIENKIISKQAMPSPAKEPLDDYEHNHVLRKSITAFSGIPLAINSLIKGNYEKGRTFEKEIEVNLDSKWRLKNLSFIILTSRYDINSKEIIQAAELKLL